MDNTAMAKRTVLQASHARRSARTATPQLTRRELFRVGGVTVGGYFLMPALGPGNVQAKARVEPRGSAEICIFLLLKGGPSQLETFDVKEGPWTPPDLDVRTIAPGLRMPVGLLPGLAERRGKFAIVRSMEAWEAEHARGVYYLQAGRIFSPARMKEIPSVGAIVAYETEPRRRESDFLPHFLSMDMTTAELVGSGCLPGRVAPMAIRSSGKLPFVVQEDERETLVRRRALLSAMTDGSRDGRLHRSDLFADIDQQYQSAVPLLSSTKAAHVFQIEMEERQRYGATSVGDACLLARNVVEADAGTRFILISHDGWDLHANAFDKSAGNNQYTLCHHLDAALSALLDDLESRSDPQGRRLIDKTFITCMGEFGRTPGALTLNQGRDHYRFAAVGVFAGAGVQGGRVLGATDETASRVVDPGWHKQRSIYPEDVLATIYSTMGIDWSKKVTRTPSGRPFDYIENISPKGYLEFGDITELFA
jgi:hypothetical protein